MQGRLGCVLFAGWAVAAGAFAQERPLYILHQEFAKPSQVPAYEAAAKDFAAMITRNKASLPHFSYVTLASDGFVYTYVAPIASYAGIDGINQDFAALAQKEGPVFADVMKRSGEATEYVREWVVSLAPELSYAPATPRLKPGEARYFHYDAYFVMPGREAEADAVGKEFVALFKAKNIPNGYRVFKTEMGPEMPALIVEVPAKDAADSQAQILSDRTALGEAGQALFAKAFSLTRRFESRDAWLRLDLSTRR